jgi:hypothetical protein
MALVGKPFEFDGVERPVDVGVPVDQVEPLALVLHHPPPAFAAFRFFSR